MKYYLCIVVLLLAACSSLPKDQVPQTKETDPVATKAVEQQDTASYIIQPGDILDISVWKEKDLQQKALVRPDGGLNFPLIGDIQAAGQSIAVFQSSIIKRLSRYIPNPVVTVSVSQAAGNKIYVLGQVRTAGEYVVNRDIDVMQALSIAGGLSPFASKNRIRILRRENGNQKVFRFQYGKVKKGKKLEQNIILKGGDVIVVP